MKRMVMAVVFVAMAADASAWTVHRAAAKGLKKIAHAAVVVVKHL